MPPLQDNLKQQKMLKQIKIGKVLGANNYSMSNLGSNQLQQKRLASAGIYRQKFRAP
jgi:hypothetical protein